MKLAILLFGHMRTFEYSSRFFMKNLAEKYDSDIFIHTWDTIDSYTKSWNDNFHALGKIDYHRKKIIKDIYHPKKLEIGHQNNKNDVIVESSDGKKRLSLNGMNYMFRSLKSANNLMHDYSTRNSISYDYVLATRPDVAIYNYLDIQETITEAESLNIDIDNARFFAGLYGDSETNVRLLCNRVTDILFFARPSVIDRYIEANSIFTKDEIDKSFKNVVSIYTRNEIKAGIQPIEICFACEKDWKNVPWENVPESVRSAL